MTELPPTFLQEGRSVRVTAGRLNFLFPDSQAGSLRRAYDRQSLRAEGHFAPRWKAHVAADIASDAFCEIIQELALHWMYSYSMNHLPLEIADSDWEHPQTRRIIQSGVKRALRPGSDAQARLCASLMGLTEAEYLKWRQADEAFLSLM